MDRRRFSTLLISLPSLVVAGAAEAARAKPRGSSSEATGAAQMISAIRARYGHGPVGIDPRMNACAQYQAGSIAQIGWLSHGDFAGRMERLGQDAAWENLALGPTTIAGVIQLWRESPGHDRNLLMRDATRIGIARVDAEAPYWALVLAR